MSWQRPTPARVWQAIEMYLEAAYPDSPPPTVRARLDTLHAVADGDFYESAVLEHDPVPEPHRYSIRLGNPFYPHMKLVIERAPDGKSHLFRADSHDKHCVPEPRSRDYDPFCRLMERNQGLTQAIESAWAAHGLPTFKTFLEDDLKRRAAARRTGKP